MRIETRKPSPEKLAEVAAEKAQVAADQAELVAETSRFQRDLTTLRTARGAVVQPLVVEGGVAFFIRKLSKEDLELIGALMIAEGFTMFTARLKLLGRRFAQEHKGGAALTIGSLPLVLSGVPRLLSFTSLIS